MQIVTGVSREKDTEKLGRKETLGRTKISMKGGKEASNLMRR